MFQVANGEYLESSTSDPHVRVCGETKAALSLRRAVVAYFKHKYMDVQVYLQSHEHSIK